MSMEVQQFLNDTGGNFTEMAPRPPVPGEETAELQSNGGISTRSSGSHKSHLSGKSHSSGKSASSHRSDVSHSPAATPRRSNLDKTLTCSSAGCSEPTLHDDDAPLGFEPEGSVASSPHFTENSTPPYLKWAESITYLLEDSDGVKLFKQFLDQDTCSNLLDFWFACKGLKMVDEDDADRILRVSKLIYKKYIKADQLRLRSELKKGIVDRLKNEVQQSIFDEAQTEVENMMKNDAYPQFLKSDIYLTYVQNGGESPKTSNNSNNSSGSSSARPLSGPLPTLREGEELSTDDIMRTSVPALPLTHASLINTRKARDPWSVQKERGLSTSMFVPSTSSRLPNPYHVSYTTVSAQDSDVTSSDALTDDTMSLTDSSVDGRDISGYGKKMWKKQQKAIRRYADVNKHTQLSQQLIPRTERAPKDRNLAEKEPEKFAALLTEKLLKWKEEQDKLERIQEKFNTLETDEESDSVKMGPPTVIPPPKVVNPAPPPARDPLNVLLALANKDSEDNAQSILEEHCSRVWDNSNGQTPTRSPGRHSPKSFDPNASIRYPYAPGPSPNVSATTLPPGHLNKSHVRRKDKDTSGVLTTASYDSGVGTDDKSGVYYHDAETHHKYVYHHHHHHHHVMKDSANAKPRALDMDAHSRSLHSHLSAPTLPNFNDSSYGSWSHRTHNNMPNLDSSYTGSSSHRPHTAHNHSHGGMWEDASRTPRPKDSKRSTAKKVLDSSSSNIDSGVGLPPENPAAPTLHDPANEKVMQWMLENDKLCPVTTTNYSTDGSDKASSHKRSSHKSSTPSQHKSVSSGGKKSQYTSQYNTSRSGSLDRSGYNSYHQPVGADYSWSADSGVQPSQPFVQDPSMPVLNPPNAITQLEEVKRRLEDESSRAKMRMSKSFNAISSSSRERRMMPPPSHAAPAGRSTSSSFKTTPQVAPLDLSSSEEHSSSHGSHKSDGKRSSRKTSSVPSTPGQSSENTVIGYFFCNEPIPYRTSLPGKNITLAQFKQLISKKGNYRYFFKTASDEFDSGVVHEEICSDNQILPLWEGKIVGKVDKKE